MNKTWTSGAIELLDHAAGHMSNDTAFDKRIAYISIDNAVEIIIKTYLSLPRQFYNDDVPSRKEISDCNNSFTAYLILLFRYAEKKLIGIEPGDIEHYHRIRNTLYHDGTGLAVDQDYLNSYFTIAKLLMKRLFNSELKERKNQASLEQLILNWNNIEELLAELMQGRVLQGGTFKWEEAITKELLTKELVMNIAHLRQLRNKTVHSKSINHDEIRLAFEMSQSILNELKQQIELNTDRIKERNLLFEPAVSEIEGTLIKKSFYGPPNYGETPDKDMIEDVLILELEHSINVHQTKKDLEEGDANHTIFNVNSIQLHTFTHKIDLKPYLNERIKLSGTLWAAQTGHHFTPVLMTVMKKL
ncbi:MAG: DUF4431 domain-containing protein [Cyclobacteriaceae bacterium]